MLNINKKSELNCALKALILKSDKNKNVKTKNKKKRGSAATALAKLRLSKLLSCPLERSDEQKKKKVKRSIKIEKKKELSWLKSLGSFLLSALNLKKK